MFEGSDLVFNTKSVASKFLREILQKLEFICKIPTVITET